MARIIAKVLYLGMFINILIPGALLAACYLYHQNYPRYSEGGNFANLLFYVFAVIAVAQAGYAIWWRGKRYHEPIARSKESLEEDLAVGLRKASRPIFILIAAISGWGYLYFMLTGRFEGCLMLVLISFVVFQVVRPRYGTMQKVIDRQLELLERGQGTRE
jgi:hypothetical protein